MTTDMSARPSPPSATINIQEDFISLDGPAEVASFSDNEDFVGLGAPSDADSDSQASSSSDRDTSEYEESFHPHHITLSAFRKLLSCYPTAVEQVHRRKLMLKMQEKPEKGSKRRAEKRAKSASANLRGGVLLQKTEFNVSELKYIRDETERFLKLDRWRYEDMPRIVAERRELSGNGGDGNTEKKTNIMNKEELITVMDWKT